MKQELFNSKTKVEDYQRQPKQLGLYEASHEHDACGVGMLVNIQGGKSHELVESALKVLENMRHRGAEGADNKTGDGAGIMLQIPHEFILLQGIPVPEKGKYGTGLLFLPKDEKDQATILSVIIEEIEKEGLTLMHLRNVPTCPEILGEAALANEPDIKQIFITGFTESETADRKLYIIRKRIENRIRKSDIPTREDFYIVSLSTKNIVYKGMLSSLQLRNYFPDLTNSYFTSGLALVHSRFSTNTFPTWGLAQPFRLLAHNGEINTIRGNRGWMEARESVLSSPALGDIREIRPIVQPGMSDSASLDNVLEFLIMSGLSLPHAMAMLVPESFNEKNPISEDLKAFYEYHSILMEPWDGPAALLFSDGRYAGGMLDRNGLRPARYLITQGGMMVVASEVGVMDFEPGDIKEKGRLQPGKILLIDTEKGEIYYDGELKKQLAEAKPYRTWLAGNRIELDELKSGRKVSHSVENYDSMLRIFGYSKEDVERLIVPMCTTGAEPINSMGNDTPLAVLSDKPQLLYNYFRQQFAQVTNPPIDPIREELVMSLTEYIGAVGMNILTPSENHCKMVRLNHPILNNAQLDILCNIRYKGFKTVKLPLLFEVAKGCRGLQEALATLCKQAEESVNEGVNYIVLSDRDVDAAHAAIPSLLAVSAVHHHLISVGKRVQTALIVESGEIREVMHAALLLGFGASALNALSTNAVFNILFCLMLLVFAASFFGAFEITLPSKWSTAVDSKAEATSGLLSIFLMAFTLSLVSFSCTGPIIGFLLVQVSTTGSVVAPAIGMLGFAIALALPFTLFALFPSWLKSMPKSGGWMNIIKVTLGFLELAFALKFLSVADLAYGWRILDRETFLALWIVLFALLGFYLLGKIKFPHDDDDTKVSVPRFFMALASLAFAVYMIPGLWGAPLKAVSAFAPPMQTQDFNLYNNEVHAKFDDYDLGMEYARQHGKPVMLDFTGYGCVNCRKMELAVWTNPKVSDIINNDYVLITLYVDNKTPLPSPVKIVENGTERMLRTVGDKWSYLQRVKFGANAQPLYVLIDNEGKPLNKSYSYDEDIPKYIEFLQTGLENYKKEK